MMTVRFPDGTSIQFNTANHVVRGEHYTDVYDHKDGQWLAQVPNTAMIEAVVPCRTYNFVNDRTRDRLEAMEREMRNLKVAVRRLLKHVESK